LILKSEMPRSLIACYDNIVSFLNAIAKAYGRAGASQSQAQELLTRIQSVTTEQIFKVGLHEFLTSFVEDTAHLGQAITEQYLLH
jgi:uncharacterized alpha-E superfamily protein